MEPRQALQILGNAAQQAAMPFRDHIAASEAIRVLTQYIDEYENHKESEPDLAQ